MARKFWVFLEQYSHLLLNMFWVLCLMFLSLADAAHGFNIFPLGGADPILSANNHPPTLKIKMILEYTQMLYTVLFLKVGADFTTQWFALCTKLGVTPMKSKKAGEKKTEQVSGPYNPTHENTQITAWVGRSEANFMYILRIALRLCERFSLERKDVGRRHACHDHLDVIGAYIKENKARVFPNNNPVETMRFVLATDMVYKLVFGTVVCFKNNRLQFEARDEKMAVWAYRRYIRQTKDKYRPPNKFEPALHKDLKQRDGWQERRVKILQRSKEMEKQITRHIKKNGMDATFENLLQRLKQEAKRLISD